MTETVSNRTVENVPGKGWIKTVPVHIAYTDTNGQIHVHKANCGDLRKYPNDLAIYTKESWEDVTYFEATSLKQIVEDTYRYGGSFYEESGYDPDDEQAWRNFAGEVRVFPCVKLPDEPTYQEENV